MTLFTRFGVALALVAAALPLAAALPGNYDSSSCKSSDFWYEEKSCCLPRGGPPSHPKPPPEKQCPPKDWSWNKEHSCCVPHYPTPPSHPPPQCSKNWKWSSATYCCEPEQHDPSSPRPSGASTYTNRKRDHPGPSSCKKSEFWFDERSCCLPRGGPSTHPNPPQGKECPREHWSWSDEHSCCIPHQPPPRYEPQCSNDHKWSADEMCCEKNDPSHPQPSGGYSQRKRAVDYTQLCPMGLTACPIASARGLSSDFECLDTTNELESCGGCASIGKGQDCTAIEGAWNVGCEQGTCAVYTCAPGFKHSIDGASCIPA